MIEPLSVVPDRALLILDCDGVLADTEPLHFAAWKRAYQEILSVNIGDDHRPIVGLPLDALHTRFAALHGQALTADLKQTLFKRKAALFLESASSLQPMPGSVALIERAFAHGWYVAVASRALRLRLHRTLQALRLPFQFDAVLGTESIVDPASDRKVHKRAADLFGIAASACIVIEDSATGVADARQCGIGRVIGFTSSLSAPALLAAGAHETIDRLDSLVL